MNGITMTVVLTTILTFTPFAALADSVQAPGNLTVIENPENVPFQDAGREAETAVRSAEIMIEKMRLHPEGRIPPEVLEQAAALAVFPEIDSASTPEMAVKPGILMTRKVDGWSLPVFISFSKETLRSEPTSKVPGALALVFNHTETIRQLVDGFDFILGSDATIAAGHPTGATPGTQVVAYAAAPGSVDEQILEGAALTVESGPLQAYYRLNQDAVREYFGETEQLVRQFLGLDQEIYATAQGIEDVPESALSLQHSLKRYGDPEGVQ
jgi:lipid-binding SYLF domain-containing protein